MESEIENEKAQSGESKNDAMNLDKVDKKKDDNINTGGNGGGNGSGVVVNPLMNVFTTVNSIDDGSRFYSKRRIVVGNLSRYLPEGLYFLILMKFEVI